MTKYILSIDCGVSTGIALLSYTEDEAPTLVEGWQFGGGVTGLLGWLEKHYREAWHDSEWGHDYAASIQPFEHKWKSLLLEDEIETHEYDPDTDEYVEAIQNPKQVTVIAEKFTARATQGFSYRTSALEPLRCEGVLIAKGLMPDYPGEGWVDPSQQYLVGGKTLPDKKKRQHAFLKDVGFYRSGKDFGTPDADDFRSAAAHSLAFLLREMRHKPTWDLVSGWTR